MGFVIENIKNFHHINDEIICCVGKQIFNNPTREFAKGIEHKHTWLRRQIERYGEAGKIAYKDTEPVGFMEFVPGKIAPIVSREKDSCVYVDCYYVLKNEQGSGVGSALLRSIVEEFSKRHSWFQGKPAKSIKLIAFEESEWKNANLLYKMGFKTELRWRYLCSQYRRTPVLLTVDIKPKKRETEEIMVKLPAQNGLPLTVKVFRSTPCPYGSPDFPEIKQAVKKFGRSVKFEIFDLWEKPELVEIYGPNPGTVVNDQMVWASPDEYKVKLENTIRGQLQKIDKRPNSR